MSSGVGEAMSKKKMASQRGIYYGTQVNVVVRMSVGGVLHGAWCDTTRVRTSYFVVDEGGIEVHIL
jgi:hypothetical protein